MARSRNRPRSTLALIFLAILALLIALAARVDATPARPFAPLDADPDPDADAAADPDAADPDPVPVPMPVPVPDPASVPASRPAHLPPVSAVLSAAFRASGLDASPAPSWRWRTRLAGLVPTISIRDGRDATWRDIADPTIGYVSVFTVSATWRLDRLLFDSNELRISAIEAARRRERRHLAADTLRAYYTYVRSAGTLAGDAAAAELDVLTDGWFSQVLSR